MTTATEAFCDQVAARLRYWVDETNRALEDPTGKRAWLNDNAFDRVRPLLRRTNTNDRAAILTDFGMALIHSLLSSLEQGPVHSKLDGFTLVEADSGTPLTPELPERFVESAIANGLVPALRCSKRA